MAETLNRVFIDIEVDASVPRETPARMEAPGSLPSRHLPGDRGGVKLVDENLDECVLCYLCVDASPKGAIRVVKLYEQ